MKRTIFTILLTITFINITLKGQTVDNALTIPDSVKKFIYNWAINNILDYRLKINPEFKPEELIKSYIPKEYYTYNDKIFKDPLVDGERLLVEISRWPKDSPKKNYYLITKKGNRFLRYREKGKTAWRSGVDTLAIPEYDVYNKYYPNDDSFVVYYDGKGIFRNVSGNFIQDAFAPEWLNVNNAPSLAAERRLAQYNADHPYRIKETNSDWLLFFKKCDFIINDPGAFIVKMCKRGYYPYFEIVYYSNKKEVTGDESNENFYEIKYVRDYSKGTWPQTYADTQPSIRKITRGEITELNKLYEEVVYKFGAIDYSKFNKN